MSESDRQRRRVLIAGIGNVFLGDDGFGVEVVRRLAGALLPGHVSVMDVGIRSLHLAYELLDGGYDEVIFVDAMPQNAAPGTVSLIEPDLNSGSRPGAADAHAMDPVSVLRLLEQIGDRMPRVLVVGCEPASVEEGIGLSSPVMAAVDGAVRLIRDLVSSAETRQENEVGDLFSTKNAMYCKSLH